MISNSSSNKLKASKSSRDTEAGALEDPSASRPVGFNDSRYRSIFIHKDGRAKSRSRNPNEFRGYRGQPAERRGAGRSRGVYYNKSERDFLDGSYRRYQEPLSKQSTNESLTNYNYGQESKSNFLYTLPEDPRISKLVRRLCGEGDVEKALAICEKLQDAIMLGENARYIKRSFDILGESLLDVLYEAPSQEVRLQVAEAFARIGYVMATVNDFNKHLDWVLNKYKSQQNQEVKAMLMLSLYNLFKLDADSPALDEYMPNVISQLQTIVEATDSAKIFTVTMDGILILSKTYPEAFAKNFIDMVDILVGWHVDETQPVKIKEFALNALGEFTSLWRADLVFSVRLLNQFLEDMVAYGEDLILVSSGKMTDNEDPPVSAEDSIQHISSLMNVFNIVTKSLGNMLNPTISPTITWNYLTESFTKMMKTYHQAIGVSVNNDLVAAGNECIYLFLELLHNKASSSFRQLFDLVIVQLSVCLQMTDKSLVSLLNLLRKIIKEISGNLPLEFISTVIGRDSNILKLRITRTRIIQETVMSVFQCLLNLKNIPLLQDAYRFVLDDLEAAYKLSVPSVEILSNDIQVAYSEIEAEQIVIFNLQCLMNIANASNSIIGMWALQPSILELLAVKLKPYDHKLACENPLIQYSVLYLLYSHSKKNNHFIASSDLVSFGQSRTVCDIFGISNISLGEVSNSSPTSGHFEIILTLFNKLFTCKLQTDSLILLLKWTEDIYSQLQKFFPTVFKTKLLMELVLNTIDAGFSLNERIIERVAANLEILVKDNSITWNHFLMYRLGNLCLIHQKNNKQSIQKTYSHIATYVPWDIIILDLIKPSDVKSEKYRSSKILTLTKTNIVSTQKEHLMRDTCGQMTQHHFKTFMNYLLNNFPYKDGWLRDTYINCWPLQNAESSICHISFYRQCALQFSSVLTTWASWEAARLCVSSKLRTSLGKPQETFTSIECAIKHLARMLSQRVNNNSLEKLDGGNQSVTELTRSRMLIEFLEHLEKAIYNAAEGCGMVLVPVIPTVKTFFHTNSSTCREWLSRVRPAALLVGLHTGHASIVVRHTHSLLMSYISSNSNTTPVMTPEILAYCLSLTRALLLINEPEAMIGVYTWVKKIFNIKLQWLKAAAEQSAMKYEVAIDSYYLTLTNQTNEGAQDEPEGSTEVSRKLENSEKEFINEQIIECYKHTQSWSDLKKWKDALNEPTPSDEASISNLTENMEDFCNWDKLLSWEGESRASWTCSNILNSSESTLKNIAINILCEREDLVDCTTSVEQCFHTLQTTLHELTRNEPSEYLTNTHILYYAASALRTMVVDRKLKDNPFYVSSHLATLKNVNPSTLGKIIWWFDYFSKINPTQNDVTCLETMRLDLVKSHRKVYNYSSAKRELIKYFSTSKNHILSEINVTQLEDIYNVFLQSPSSYDLNVWTVCNVTAITEASKLLYVKEETKEMAISLCASASLGVSQRLTLGEHSYELREIGTRMLLTLSKWVQNENDKLLINNLNSPLTKLVTALPEIGLVNNNVSANVIPILDSAVGKLLQFSVNQCPGLAKAWFTFGSWCFRWGRKMVEYSSNTGGQLTQNDKLQIKNIMVHGIQEDLDTVCEILSKTRVSCDDEDIDWNEINTSEMIESQLRSVPSLHNSYPEHLVLLVDIWRQAQKRVFSYYELSADAYFKFLDLSSSSEKVNHNGECAIVTATLRLLRLIVKHAMELQNVLESGLANTPTHPWKVIIPQLFSRLNHPENYVRRRVSELLCRLAEDTPHLITFPAVVGAVENEKINLADISFPKSIFSETANTEQETEENSDNSSESENQKDNDLNSCFLDMVETLSKQAPETILQVQLLVKELRRINLLWDELWLGTLAQHHSEISKRLNQLEIEIARVKNNSTLQKDEKERLIKEKNRIIMKPILFVLEQLAEITSATPETPHEQYFQDKFLDSINSMLEKLRNPSEPDKPQESWLPIKELQFKLQQKCSKKSSYALRMSDISPTLAKMNNTVISMPGVHTSSTVRVTIKSIHNSVAILPTKTKPKKLIFHGSDGKIYTYLFKGMEDLHLDERIMQFLSIMNTMLAHDREDNIDQTYRARHYSVIPLGPRSGLISWVDNLTPLFALYKRWQQREAAMLTAKNNKFVNVLRLSELFYNKLTPLLNSAGVSIENRKEWPVSILKKVLTELMAETPKDLLSKELWCGSVTPGQWWRTLRRYSFSVAVMSAIGYIIGLGDRHLDNVLVDLSTGEVVHIDYNVCFEKGKTLRVPEKVPFRMTPNLEHALGVTGVEGIFRLACEHVLKTAKRGRETLLTLLEAFVYDPLVEWGGGGAGTAGATGGAGAHGSAAGSSSEARGKRARLERKCARDMLMVRIAEIRHDWSENREEIVKQIAITSNDAANWLEHLQVLSVAEGNLQHNHRQMALVKELEALGSKLPEHPLFPVSQRYAAYKQMKDAFDESAKTLHDLFQDCNKKIENYNVALDTIKSPQLNQWIQELNFPIEHDGHLVFDLIREFLLNAGQSGMIAQCEQSETELGQVARQQTLLIKSCLELLTQYSAVVQYYPQSFLEKHRLVLYRKWTGILLETESPDVCRDVLTQMQNFLSSENPNNPATQQLVTFSYGIQTLHNEANGKLKKLYDRIQAEGGKDALPRCENNLIEAKNCIRNFKMQENGGEKAIEFMTISALCSLNRRYLMLESGAQSAGDSLVDLTSRDGEWFFDDMSIISSLINEFVGLIPPHHNGSNLNDERIPVALDCLRASRSIFVDLQELSYNFQMIILPEAVKKIQSEDPSVLLMINELNNLVINMPCPLEDLLGQLEMHLRYVIMEMDSPATNSLIIAADLQARYDTIVNGPTLDSPSAVPSPGRMLLMGSDGLFKPLIGRGPSIVDAIIGLHVPHVWKKVDHIGEAKDLAAPLHNEQLRVTLEFIFLIKRIQTLTDFFNRCVQMSCAFKGVAPPVVYDDERLFKSIKRFIADYIGRQFLGVQSQCLSITICLLLQRLGLNVNMEIEQRDIGVSWKVSLEELVEICIANSVKSGILTPSALQQATALNANLDAAHRRCEAMRSLERSINIATSNANRLSLQSLAHSWLRSEGRPAGALPASGSPIPAPPAAELKKFGQQLAVLQPKLATVLEKHRVLVTSAEQRLKWASGANPALNEVMAAFECAVNIREDRLNVERNLAQSIANVCNALGVVGEQGPCKGLPALAQKRRNALSLMARAPAPPPPLYESLLQLLTPENGIDAHWVSSVSGVLKDMINQLQKHIVELKTNLETSHEELKNSVNKLANLKSIHEKLIFDAKGLLKSISKYQESSVQKLQEYLSAHDFYMSDMTKVIDSLSADTISEQDVALAIELSGKLEQETPSIYNELISFEGGWQGEDAMYSKRRGTLVRQVAGVWSSPARQTPPRSRVIQQQNSYAASVWKRVRLKLEGRDPDPARKYTNQQQVDYIIKEAMSVENLCLLYEGWTPWV